MTTENRGVMSRWMRESMAALEQLRRERDHHEHALEAAMEAIRVHTQAIDALERDIGVIEKAMAGTEATPSEPVPPMADDEFDVSLTMVVPASTVVPPRPPPLRPVPRVVGQR